MDSRKLIPYSVYLPIEHHTKLKAIAQNRKASELIRNAIQMIIDGNDAYVSGYNKGIKDSADIISKSEEAQMVAIKGKDLGSILTSKIEALEIRK